MPGAIPDPSYLPPSLDFLVGVLPTPALTDLGGGLVEIRFPKTKIQTAIWNYLQVNQHYVVNVCKCSAGLIVLKSSDVVFYKLRVQLEAGDVWENGDSLAPQVHKFVMYFSNRKMADALARPRDFVLGWRDDGTWGVLKQRDDYTQEDASTLDISPGDDLDANAGFDIQTEIATGRVINICKHNSPRGDPMGGLSDNVPPLQVQRNVAMTVRAAIDACENARAQSSG